MYQARYRFTKRNDGTDVPGMIQVLEQVGEVPNLLSRAPTAPVNQGIRALADREPGEPAGVADVRDRRAQHEVRISGRVRQSLPDLQLPEPAHADPDERRRAEPADADLVVGGHIKYVRNLIPTNFYAQDQWTINRLTVQGGIRYDSLISSYPDSRVGGPGYPFAPEEIFYPSRSTPGYDWKDISPRLGVAYDLFGNGKTAVRFNIGKYMEAITATNNDLDMNPLVRTVVRTTRGWTDTDQDYVPDCDLMNPAANGECARMDNQNLGRQVFTRSFDPNYVGGLGARPYNWGLGLSVQQEVLPRVSVTVGVPSQLVGQLVRRRQPGHEPRGLHAVQHPGRRAIRGCPAAAVTRSTASTTSCRTRLGWSTSSRSRSKNFGEQTGELAGLRLLRRGAAGLGADGAGWRGYRAQACRRLRGAGEAAGARSGSHRPAEQFGHGERAGDDGRAAPSR